MSKKIKAYKVFDSDWKCRDFQFTVGYLKKLDYKEAWKKSWDKAIKEDKAKLEKLPNFDWGIFTEITGIEKD